MRKAGRGSSLHLGYQWSRPRSLRYLRKARPPGLSRLPPPSSFSITLVPTPKRHTPVPAHSAYNAQQTDSPSLASTSRMTTRSLTTGLALASLLLPGALAATLQVHHRLLHLSSDVELPQFEHRGAIDLSPPGSSASTSSSILTTKFQPDSGSSAVIEEWINRWKKDPTYHNGEIFYQVALQRAEEDTPDMWDVQSVRLVCLDKFAQSEIRPHA